MAYVLETRRRFNGKWTSWDGFDFNPNLEYAQKSLNEVLEEKMAVEDRPELMPIWKEISEKAKTLEVGEILECDERQWRIVMQ